MIADTLGVESFIVLASDIDESGRELVLRDEEAHHALRSLRLRVGDGLMATNLVGTSYYCTYLGDVVGATKGTQMRCRIEEVLHGFGESRRRVELVQAVLSQPSRWEFLLEKATELGVDVITPVVTEHTERRSVKVERSERVLRAATKQVKRSNQPWLRLRDPGPGEAEKGVYSLFEALSELTLGERTIFFLYEGHTPSETLHRRVRTLAPHASCAVVIGPEGGFTEAEVHRATEEFGVILVSLGTRRLRAETAALSALTLVLDE